MLPDYSISEAIDMLKLYFGRELTLKEKSHYLVYIATSFSYWFIWAIYEVSIRSGRWRLSRDME